MMPRSHPKTHDKFRIDDAVSPVQRFLGANKSTGVLGNEFGEAGQGMDMGEPALAPCSV
jgi:hypothetical protein